MIKIIFKYTLLSLLCLFLIAFVYLTTTSTGLNIIVNKLNTWQPQNLQISQVQGAFNRNIKIAQIHYKNATTDINIKNISLRIQPLALFLAELRVTQLHIDTVRVTTISTNNNSPIQPPHWQLPLRLRLQDFLLEHLILTQNKQTTRYNTINANAYLKSNYANIEQFNVTKQKKTFTLQGYLDLQPIALNLHFQLKQANKILVDTRLQGLGSWKKLSLRNSMLSPVIMNNTISINDIFTHLTWQLKGHINSQPLGKLNASLDSLKLNGNYSAYGSNNSLNFSGELKSNEQELASKIMIEAESNDLKKQQLQAKLSWQNLSWPLQKNNQYQSAQGQITLTGSLKSLAANIQLAISGHYIPQGNWQAQTTITPGRIMLTKLKGNILSGIISGKGQFSLRANHPFKLQLQANKLNPAVKWFDWPGRISFNLIAQGNKRQQQVQLLDLAGKLRQQTLAGSLQTSIMQGQLKSLHSQLSMGQANIHFAGTENNTIKANWLIDIPNLALLTPFGGGSIHSEGGVAGTKERPVINGSINTNGFAYMKYQVKSLTSQFDINVNSPAKSVFLMKSTFLRDDKFFLPRLNIDARGNEKKQRIKLHFVYHKETFNTLLHSEHKKLNWLINMPMLTMTSVAVGDWYLEKPTLITITPTQFILKDFSWRSYQQSIIANLNLLKNAQGRFIPQSSDIHIKNLTLEMLSLFLPAEISAKGHLNFEATIKKNKNKQQAKLDLSTKNAFIRYKHEHNIKKWNIQKLTYHGLLNEQGIKSQLNLVLDKADHLSFMARLPKAHSIEDIFKSNNISSSLQASFADINFLNLFLPQMRNISGALSANLTGHGSWHSPILKGNAAIHNASASLPAHGLTLKNINLSATGGKKQLKWQLSLNSGTGKLQVIGGTAYAHPKQSTLHITGSNFTIANTAEYKIAVSPNLSIKTHPSHIKITGNINIPMANITILPTPDIQKLPSDVTIISAVKPAKRAKSMFDNIQSNITLNLGKNIEFNAFNLKSQLQGSIALIDNSRSTSHATGEITLTQGSYQVFGQELTIKDGKLLFAGGPVNNPGLDIRASKEIKTFVNPTKNSLTNNSLSNSSDSVAKSVNIPLQAKTITVGASVTNTLLAPTITLYSNQADLTKADILSYLIFGFPISQASNQQGEALWQAASALSANSSDISGIMQQLKSRFALNSIGFESSSYLNTSSNTVQQNTSLVLGKMLSPDLYIKYSIGLIEPINTLSAAYTIDEHWTAQTETNSLGNGVDLIYSWESG
jgi:translocation and assembly module TamB